MRKFLALALVAAFAVNGAHAATKKTSKVSPKKPAVTKKVKQSKKKSTEALPVASSLEPSTVLVVGSALSEHEPAVNIVGNGGKAKSDKQVEHKVSGGRVQATNAVGDKVDPTQDSRSNQNASVTHSLSYKQDGVEVASHVGYWNAQQAGKNQDLNYVGPVGHQVTGQNNQGVNLGMKVTFGGN